MIRPPFKREVDAGDGRKGVNFVTERDHPGRWAGVSARSRGRPPRGSTQAIPPVPTSPGLVPEAWIRK